MNVTLHAIERYMQHTGATDWDAARYELERLALAAVPCEEDRGASHDVVWTASGSMTLVRYKGTILTVYVDV